MCECHQIGGPFIAEDPQCPVHGAASQDREYDIAMIIDRAVIGEITSSEAASMVTDLYC